MYRFELQENERIIKKGHASLHIKHDAWTGAFYLTNERLVFVGYIMDISRKYMEDISLALIDKISAGKTFFVIPNVLEITTLQGRKLKFIVHGRDAWLKAIAEELQEQAGGK